MKKLLLALILLISLAPITADIGPSPNYDFELTNISDYPEYDFYYSGVIWPDQPELISGTMNVYKLNFPLWIYAVPKNSNPEPPIYENGELITNYPISGPMQLSGGTTSFKIKNISETTISLMIENTQKSKPEPMPLFDILIIIGAIILLILLIWIFKKR